LAHRAAVNSAICPDRSCLALLVLGRRLEIEAFADKFERVLYSLKGAVVLNRVHVPRVPNNLPIETADPIPDIAVEIQFALDTLKAGEDRCEGRFGHLRSPMFELFDLCGGLDSGESLFEIVSFDHTTELGNNAGQFAAFRYRYQTIRYGLY
jgi:hypothetical protein